MDRRGFFKILSATSAGALAGSCHKTDHLIPLLVPERDIVPGREQWHPAVCTECAAGCGTLVRIMEGVRTIERGGEKLREPIAAVKKIEGNPLDPVSGGRLCARGQAAVQSLYHPDRLRGPMKRTGDRGKAQFAATTWAEATAAAAGKIAKADRGRIVFLVGPHAGTRSMAIAQFAKALGAPEPVVCSIADYAVERKAAELVLGWKGLPVYDLARARHVLGVGADFLGGWASPVYYARQFGAFRQGRLEVRGRLVQAESRLSITAAAADRWLPLAPGSEPLFLAAVGRILLDAGLPRNRAATPAIDAAFASADVPRLLAACGLEERRVRETVQALGESEAPLVLAGASIVHSNSLEALVLSHYLNLMLGNVGKPGGMLPPAPATTAPFENRHAAEALAGAQVVLIDGSNPAYTLPPSSGVLEALAHADTVISFAGLLDDTAAWSDLILPGHHALESELAVVPAVSLQPAVTLAVPFVQPLYDTRAVEATLTDLARQMSVEYKTVTAKDLLPPDASFEDAAREGGVWGEVPSPAAKPPSLLGPALLATSPPEPPTFAGDPSQFPLLFQPYPSLQFHDGAGANLPWLQEMPDPTSSSIWGLPVEVDPQLAARLNVSNGDILRVESPHGYLEGPAFVHPGAIPGVVSMAIGDGHAHYSRYATGRGANPLSILAPVWEKSTGALAMGGTRVRLARAGPARGWIQFAAPDREERGSEHR